MASLPILLRAGLVLSGMFGIRLDGVDKSGLPIRYNVRIPVNLNIPVDLAQEVNYIDISRRLNHNPNCFGKCFSQTGPSQFTPKIKINSESLLKPLKSNLCGPNKCTKKEICVSWTKRANHNRQESPKLYECFPNDGHHHNKMKPSFNLCEKGETYSILPRSQSCLRHQPPCELSWEYVCVNERESPHNCSIKHCPEGPCIEVVHCNRHPPCYLKAFCTPEFHLPIPTKLRHSELF